MKKFSFIAALAIAALSFAACGGTGTADPTKADSTANIIPPPDNSAATNPSLADTSFSHNHADTANMKRDSMPK